MNAELAEKRARLLGLLDAEALDAIVLRRPGNVAWYSGGGRTNVLAMQEAGVAAVVVRHDGDTVVTAVNEAARLAEEELAALGSELRAVPWDAELADALPVAGRVGTDLPLAGAHDVAARVEAVRRSLTARELDRYRALGRDAAEAVTRACLELEPSASEHAAAARTAAHLLERGADPVVLLVAGADRLPRHRHPLPTGAPLGALAMVVVCARRHGLIVSLTRLVAFRPLPAALRDAFGRLLEVDAAFNAATVPGARVGAAFARGCAAYAANGFDAEEWRLHHQGGPTGYEPRDYLATATSGAVVEPAQAFAWNPSARSVKSEDTVLAVDGGPEILTVDATWPTALVGGLERPLVLER